jgi:hypothetical protein
LRIQLPARLLELSADKKPPQELLFYLFEMPSLLPLLLKDQQSSAPAVVMRNFLQRTHGKTIITSVFIQLK